MDQDDGLWEAAWPKAGPDRAAARARSAPRQTAAGQAGPRSQPMRDPDPRPVRISERRVYRAGGDAEGHKMRRTPILAVIILIAIAVVITFAGVAARNGALDGPQGDVGTFKLLPLTTTTTS